MATAKRHGGRLGRVRSMLSYTSAVSTHEKRARLTRILAASLFSLAVHATDTSADEPVSLVMPRAVIQAVAEPETTAQSEVVQVVGKQPEPRKSSPSRALLQRDMRDTRNSGVANAAPRPSDRGDESYVQPAAGGVLDSWFGGQTNKKAKKEHEDGRKATALPPPDPSTVDWSGIPFHRPRTESAPAKTTAEPLRDTTRGTVPSATANLRRPPAKDATRAIPSQPISSRPTTSNERVGIGVVPTPRQQLGVEAKTPTAPLPTVTTNPHTSTSPGISATRSTRRSDRNVDETVPAPVPALDTAQQEVASEPVVLTEQNDFPIVPRRELMPIDSTTSTLPSVSGSATSTRRTEETLPMLPKAESPARETTSSPASGSGVSLEDSWRQVGSGTTANLMPQPTVPKTSTSSSTLDASATTNASKSELPKPDATATEPTTTGTTKPAASATSTGIAGSPSAGSAQPQVQPDGKSEQALRDQLFQSPAASMETGSALKIKSDLNPRSEPSSKQLAASEVPGVRVVTEGPSQIMIRDLTQYEIRVENRGAFDATGVVVRSSLPSWAQVEGHNASLGSIKSVNQSGLPQLHWTIDKLPAGVVERMFVRVKAMKSGEFDVATDWTMMPQKHVAKVTVREPKLTVVIDGPEQIIYGRSEKYRVRVMNPGDGDASNVVFTLGPNTSSPQSQSIGNIPAGKEAQFEIELTARELGELKIGGMATADREVKTEALKTVNIAAAKMEAELTGPSLKYQNTDATYRLVVNNKGKANCESINASIQLPAGVKYVSGVPQAVMQGDRLTWKIDAMQPGAMREYDIVCKMDRTGEMLLTFQCEGSAAGRANVSIATRVEAIADLVLVISDPVAPAPVNQEVVYEININNRGSKAAEEVRVLAQFGHGIEPIRVEGQTGEVITGQALFNPIKRIEPNSSVKLKVYAKADRVGDHRFRTEVRYGETSLSAEEATMYLEPPAERISRRSTEK